LQSVGELNVKQFYAVGEIQAPKFKT